MTYGIRDEYTPRFGRQVLTIWSPPFMSIWEAEAHELPGHGGYMVTDYNGDKVRVSCESPRTGANYHRVDAALITAMRELHRGRRSVLESVQA